MNVWLVNYEWTNEQPVSKVLHNCDLIQSQNLVREQLPDTYIIKLLSENPVLLT